MKNHYQVLGLPQNASPRRIKEQYRKLAKLYHPDRLVNSADQARFAEKFREISEAYQALAEVVQQANLSPQERKLSFLYQQGRQLFDEKKWSKALTVFNEIMAIDPDYKDSLTWFREARRKYKALIALYTEANTLFQQKKWSETVTTFEAVLREAPNFRDAQKKLKKARRELLTETFLTRQT
jgi:tetratricopeptide (TPR) repeat protein